MGEISKRETSEISLGWDIAKESKKEPVFDAKNYVAWVYNADRRKGQGGFELASRTKIARTLNDTFYVPKKIDGVKINKVEMKLLLNVQRNWGEFLIGKPELALVLVKMNRRENQDLVAGMISLFSASSLVLIVAQILGANSIWSNANAVGLSIVSLVAMSLAAAIGISEKQTNYAPNWILARSVPEAVPSSLKEFYQFLGKDRKSIIDQYWKDADFLLGESEKIPSEFRDYKPLDVEKYKSLYRDYRENKSSIAFSGQPLALVAEPQGWRKALDVLVKIKKEWLDWEMDILKVVQYPALFDLRETATADFHKALYYAESSEPSAMEAYSTGHPFAKAVADLQFMWSMAKSEAQRIQQSNFKPEERVRLTRALDLLRIALNSSGTLDERQSSYKRAMNQLAGLIQVPTVLVDSIESGIGLRELEK